jgi:hypothetical protein
LRGSATVELGQRPETPALEARVLDVGVGGMALLTRNGAPPGFLRIRFKLGPQSGEFDVGGTVVRERLQDDARVWGVRFCALDLGTRVRLRDYVARTNRRHTAA